jgi:23S rRNA pseudouridine1911/1915/1917 synthase
MPPFHLAITAEKQGSPTRLDVWLSANVTDLSRRRAQRLILDNSVTLNGGRARKSDLVKEGDLVEIHTDPASRNWTALPAPQLDFETVYVDTDLLAVVKPAGVPTVPLFPNEPQTLAGAIASCFPECATIGRRPGDSGLIHRLDTETSGLLVAARNAKTFERLLKMQRNDQIEKRYTALVKPAGTELPSVIDIPLGRTDRGGRKVRRDPSGTPATTLVRPVERHGEFLLVEATIHRGLQHQIRAHLAHAGFPIVNDPLYGDVTAKGSGRMFLHATSIVMRHPSDPSRDLRPESQLPVELVEFLDELGYSKP